MFGCKSAPFFYNEVARQLSFRSLVVWNTNDTTITNRSHTNNVAIETYVPIKFEQEIRESTFYEILLTLYIQESEP